MKYPLFFLLCALALSACGDRGPVSSGQPSENDGTPGKRLSSSATVSAPVAGKDESRASAADSGPDTTGAVSEGSDGSGTDSGDSGTDSGDSGTDPGDSGTDTTEAGTDTTEAATDPGDSEGDSGDSGESGSDSGDSDSGDSDSGDSDSGDSETDTTDSKTDSSDVSVTNPGTEPGAEPALPGTVVFSATPDSTEEWGADEFELSAAAISGDTLTVTASYGGGCEEHDFTLVASEAFMESDPVQLQVALAHNANADACERWVTQDYSFDLLPIKERFQGQYHEKPEPGTIVLQLEDAPAELVYEFTE